MGNDLNEIVWKQFGASIDMLENAIVMCPLDQWDTDSKFWYIAYHTLFFLDYYLTPDPENFAPPAPFTVSEFEDREPERCYTREELVTYLHFCRNKCHLLLKNMTDKTQREYWTNASKSMHYPMIEILIYNLRHVQHHAAQLNLLLRQAIDDAPNWVSRTHTGLGQL